MNLSRFGKVTRISDAVSAGTSTVTSDAVDMQGYDACTFLVVFGDIVSGAATSVKAQQSSDDGSSDSYADLKGTSITVADDDDDKVAILEVDRPQERYLKCIVSRATENSAVDAIIAIQTKAIVEPVTHSDTVLGSEYHHAPAEGTA